MNSRHHFRPANRIRSPREFSFAFKSGRRARATPFVIISQPNALSIPRLGIAVAKRVVPKATDRNYLKRMVRESFRCNAADLGAVDIIIQIAQTTAYISRGRLTEILRTAWFELKRQHPRI